MSNVENFPDIGKDKRVSKLKAQEYAAALRFPDEDMVDVYARIEQALIRSGKIVDLKLRRIMSRLT